jgi:hypothetical protein
MEGVCKQQCSLSVIKYEEHIDELVLWCINEALSSTIVLPKQYAPTYYRNLITLYLCPYIVRKTTLSDNR